MSFFGNCFMCIPRNELLSDLFGIVRAVTRCIPKIKFYTDRCQGDVRAHLTIIVYFNFNSELFVVWAEGCEYLLKYVYLWTVGCSIDCECAQDVDVINIKS